MGRVSRQAGCLSLWPTSSFLMGKAMGRVLHSATPNVTRPSAPGSCRGVVGAKPDCRAKQLKRPLLGDRM